MSARVFDELLMLHARRSVLTGNAPRADWLRWDGERWVPQQGGAA